MSGSSSPSLPKKGSIKAAREAMLKKNATPIKPKKYRISADWKSRGRPSTVARRQQPSVVSPSRPVSKAIQAFHVKRPLRSPPSPAPLSSPDSFKPGNGASINENLNRPSSVPAAPDMQQASMPGLGTELLPPERESERFDIMTHLASWVPALKPKTSQLTLAATASPNSDVTPSRVSPFGMSPSLLQPFMYTVPSDASMPEIPSPDRSPSVPGLSPTASASAMSTNITSGFGKYTPGPESADATGKPVKVRPDGSLPELYLASSPAIMPPKSPTSKMAESTNLHTKLPDDVSEQFAASPRNVSPSMSTEIGQRVNSFGHKKILIEIPRRASSLNFSNRISDNARVPASVVPAPSATQLGEFMPPYRNFSIDSLTLSSDNSTTKAVKLPPRISFPSAELPILSDRPLNPYTATVTDEPGRQSNVPQPLKASSPLSRSQDKSYFKDMLMKVKATLPHFDLTRDSSSPHRDSPARKMSEVAEGLGQRGDSTPSPASPSSPSASSPESSLKSSILPVIEKSVAARFKSDHLHLPENDGSLPPKIPLATSTASSLTRHPFQLDVGSSLESSASRPHLPGSSTAGLSPRSRFVLSSDSPTNSLAFQPQPQSHLPDFPSSMSGSSPSSMASQPLSGSPLSLLSGRPGDSGSSQSRPHLPGSPSSLMSGSPTGSLEFRERPHLPGSSSSLIGGSSEAPLTKSLGSIRESPTPAPETPAAPPMVESTPKLFPREGAPLPSSASPVVVTSQVPSKAIDTTRLSPEPPPELRPNFPKDRVATPLPLRMPVLRSKLGESSVATKKTAALPTSPKTSTRPLLPTLKPVARLRDNVKRVVEKLEDTTTGLIHRKTAPVKEKILPPEKQIQKTALQHHTSSSSLSDPGAVLDTRAARLPDKPPRLPAAPKPPANKPVSPQLKTDAHGVNSNAALMDLVKAHYSKPKIKEKVKDHRVPFLHRDFWRGDVPKKEQAQRFVRRQSSLKGEDKRSLKRSMSVRFVDIPNSPKTPEAKKIAPVAPLPKEEEARQKRLEQQRRDDGPSTWRRPKVQPPEPPQIKSPPEDPRGTLPSAYLTPNPLPPHASPVPTSGSLLQPSPPGPPPPSGLGSQAGVASPQASPPGPHPSSPDPRGQQAKAQDDPVTQQIASDINVWKVNEWVKTTSHALDRMDSDPLDQQTDEIAEKLKHLLNAQSASDKTQPQWNRHLVAFPTFTDMMRRAAEEVDDIPNLLAYYDSTRPPEPQRRAKVKAPPPVSVGDEPVLTHRRLVDTAYTFMMPDEATFARFAGPPNRRTVATQTDLGFVPSDPVGLRMRLMERGDPPPDEATRRFGRWRVQQSAGKGPSDTWWHEMQESIMREPPTRLERRKVDRVGTESVHWLAPTKNSNVSLAQALEGRLQSESPSPEKDDTETEMARKRLAAVASKEAKITKRFELALKGTPTLKIDPNQTSAEKTPSVPSKKTEAKAVTTEPKAKVVGEKEEDESLLSNLLKTAADLFKKNPMFAQQVLALSGDGDPKVKPIQQSPSLAEKLEFRPRVEGGFDVSLGKGETRKSTSSADAPKTSDLKAVEHKGKSGDTATRKSVRKDDDNVKNSDTATKKGDISATKTDTTAMKDTKKGDSTARKGDATPRKGDTTARKGDTTARKGDATPRKGDTTARKGDTTARKGDTTARKDLAFDLNNDTAKKKMAPIKDKDPLTKDSGENVTEGGTANAIILEQNSGELGRLEMPTSPRERNIIKPGVTKKSAMMPPKAARPPLSEEAKSKEGETDPGTRSLDNSATTMKTIPETSEGADAPQGDRLASTPPPVTVVDDVKEAISKVMLKHKPRTLHEILPDTIEIEGKMPLGKAQKPKIPKARAADVKAHDGSTLDAESLPEGRTFDQSPSSELKKVGSERPEAKPADAIQTSQEPLDAVDPETDDVNEPPDERADNDTDTSKSELDAVAAEEKKHAEKAKDELKAIMDILQATEDADEKAKAEAEANAKAEAKAKEKAEREKAEREKAEEKANREAAAKAAAEAREKAAAEERSKAEAQQRADAEAKAKVESEARKKADAERAAAMTAATKDKEARWGRPSIYVPREMQASLSEEDFVPAATPEIDTMNLTEPVLGPLSEGLPTNILPVAPESVPPSGIVPRDKALSPPRDYETPASPRTSPPEDTQHLSPLQTSPPVGSQPLASPRTSPSQYSQPQASPRTLPPPNDQPPASPRQSPPPDNQPPASPRQSPPPDNQPPASPRTSPQNSQPPNANSARQMSGLRDVPLKTLGSNLAMKKTVGLHVGSVAKTKEPSYDQKAVSKVLGWS